MASPEKIAAGKAFLSARAKFKKAEAAWQAAKATADRSLSVDEQNALLAAVLRKEQAKEQAERDARNKARLRSVGFIS
jgi:hypothetical protein